MAPRRELPGRPRARPARPADPSGLLVAARRKRAPLTVSAAMLMLTVLIAVAEARSGSAAPASSPEPGVSRFFLDLDEDAGFECDFRWRKGSDEVRNLVLCLGLRFHPPGGAAKALQVAHCESDFRADDFNETGCGGAGCVGVFQQHRTYWAERARAFGHPGASGYNARANIAVSMALASYRGTWAIDWPVCGA